MKQKNHRSFNTLLEVDRIKKKIDMDSFVFFITTMEQLRKEFQNEVREVFTEDYKEYEDVDDLILDKYNSFELTKYECMEFLGKNFDPWEMEEEVCKYTEEEFGYTWEERGVVKIVMFWRYMVAREYIAENKEEMMKEE